MEYIFLSFYLFIFRERGREGEREGEKHQRVAASHVPPSGDLARNPGMCPDWESNWQPPGLQAGAQSTELHQPGLGRDFCCRRQLRFSARSPCSTLAPDVSYLYDKWRLPHGPCF